MSPQGPDRRTGAWVAFACLFLVFSTIDAVAQIIDFEKDRVPMADLNGRMRFHTGDDPRWAEPDFDDSSWSLLQPTFPWGAQGYPSYSGVAWYRFRLVVPRQHPQFAILFYDVWGSYQVFSNGQLIGQMGQLPPREQPYFDAGNVYVLPPEAEPGRPIEIAVRVWCWKQWAGNCGLGWLSRVGESDRLVYWLRTTKVQSLWDRSAANYQAAIQLLAGLAGLGLFLLRKREREYLWFGLFDLLAAVKIIVESSADAYNQPVKSYLVRLDIANLAAALCFLVFLFHICRLRRTGLFWAAAIWASADLCLLLSATKEWIPLYQYRQTGPIMEVLYLLFASFLVFRGMQWGRPDARLILVPVGLDCGVRLLIIGCSVLPWRWVPHVLWLQALIGRLRGQLSVFDWPFPVTLPQLANGTKGLIASRRQLRDTLKNCLKCFTQTFERSRLTSCSLLHVCIFATS